MAILFRQSIADSFIGNSSPFQNLTTENLQYLTVENVIKDFVNFANHVALPFAPSGSNAQDVPWVFMAGSYGGSIAAWTAR